DAGQCEGGGDMTMRGLLLDFYGTLVHEDDDVIAGICEQVRMAIPAGPSRPPADAIGARWWDQFREACATALGATFVSQREVGRQSLLATCEEVGATVDVDALIAAQFDHWSAPPMFPETPAFLAALRERALPVCIVSNIDRVDIEAAMGTHGIAVDRVLTSEDVRSYKPNPELFLAGLSALGLRAGEVLHVGDSRSSDVAGATALGIPVAWVNRSGKLASDGPAATHEVADLTALLPLLGG
ncbi:MAG: HAD-IA family hydrolase, partial [Thermomicrobiales bacterium]